MLSTARKKILKKIFFCKCAFFVSHELFFLKYWSQATEGFIFYSDVYSETWNQVTGRVLQDCKSKIYKQNEMNEFWFS